MSSSYTSRSKKQRLQRAAIANAKQSREEEKEKGKEEEESGAVVIASGKKGANPLKQMAGSPPLLQLSFFLLF